MGKIAEQDIARIVVNQRELGLPFGQAAVGLGLLSDEDLRRALAIQYAYPYVEVGGSSISSRVVTAHRPFDSQSEVFRSLRSQLNMRWFKERRKTLAVMSPRRGTGVSTIAANLAVSFAQLGKRTLLIDANLRAPRQHELFGLKNTGGLSNVLTGRSAPSAELSAVPPFEHLTVLCAGPTPPNPQELLSRPTFSYLIETAPSSFDVILIDASPLLDYSDALVVSALAAGSLLVTRRDKTRIEDVERVKRQLLPTGAVLVGTVLNS
jgi:chain length determinant protein tyrosine kinase EpsG